MIAIDQNQQTTDINADSSNATKVAGSLRYHDSILGPVTSTETQMNGPTNLKASSGYDSRADYPMPTDHTGNS